MLKKNKLKLYTIIFNFTFLIFNCLYASDYDRQIKEYKQKIKKRGIS